MADGRCEACGVSWDRAPLVYETKDSEPVQCDCGRMTLTISGEDLAMVYAEELGAKGELVEPEGHAALCTGGSAWSAWRDAWLAKRR